MPWAAAAAVVGGSLLSSNAAKSAAQTSANAQLESARIAAEAQKFRPVGVTSRFGTSNFGFDENGYLNEAGYTTSGDLTNYQNYLAGLAPQAQEATTGLLNLGNKYIGEDPNAVRQRYIQQQNAMLAPENEQALAGIRNNLFQTGRMGLATGATQAGNMAATNPEMAAYYNALAKQNAALTAGADQAAQQQIGFGQGLLSSAYSPLQANIGLQDTFDTLGMKSLQIGAELGGRSATAGANVGNTLMQGGMGAARTMQAANSYSPWGSAISGAASNPAVQNALGQWRYQQPVQQGQYTPGSNTFMGPMPQQQPQSAWPTGYENF
jgi:hypothetical protein